MNYWMIALTFLGNQILTGTLIEQIHYLVVESLVP